MAVQKELNIELKTTRLRLRKWLVSDRDAFTEMNAHPEVMNDFGRPLTRAESDAKFNRYVGAFENHNFGRWLIETYNGDYLGYCGVMPSNKGHPLGGHHEIGWRLVRHAWGHGYATEAARAALEDIFQRIGLAEVLAYTTEENTRSQAVMRKLRLERDMSRDFFSQDLIGYEWPGLVWVARPIWFTDSYTLD